MLACDRVLCSIRRAIPADHHRGAGLGVRVLPPPDTQADGTSPSSTELPGHGGMETKRPSQTTSSIDTSSSS